MRILCCGDQHITNRRPKNRTDDYFDTVLYKFIMELEIAKEENCNFILLPGDVFDSFKENHKVVQAIIYAIKKIGIPVYAIAGQHDEFYHNPDLSGTPLETCVAAGVITILTKNPWFEKPNVCIYGASWNAEIPEIQNHEYLNILVIHKMIVNEKLWAEQEGHTWANHMLMKSGFDLIVSGDNHQQFTVSKGGKHLVNMGSMMRSTIAQLDHKPAVTVYDTETKKIEIIDLDIKPFETVMRIEKALKEKEKDKQLESFVQSLKKVHPELNDGTVKLDFVSKLNAYTDNEENEIDQSVKDILKECLV